MKKSKLVLIGIISFFILILGILAYLYFGTDIFKSNKKMFYKYSSQLDLNGFADFKEFEKISENLLNKSHTNEGSLALNLTDQIEEKYDFITKNNVDEKKSNGEIKYSQDGDQKIQINYFKDEDLFAFKFNNVFKKQQMVIKNNKINDIVEKFNINLNDIPDITTIENNQIDEQTEEIIGNVKNIFSKYKNIIMNEIPEKNYSKIKKQIIDVDGESIEADGYKLVLNGKELSNVLKKCLETSKEDQEILNLVNLVLKMSNQNEITIDELKEMIGTFEQNMQFDDNKTEETNDVITTIEVYKNKNKLVKFYVKIGNDTENGQAYIDFSIENNKIIKFNLIQESYDDNLKDYNVKESIAIKSINDNGKEGYNFSFVMKQRNIDINFDIEILLNSIDENTYNIIANIKANLLGTELNINLDNTTKFEDNVEVEEIESESKLFLSDFKQDELEDFTKKLGEKIQAKVDFNKTIIGSLYNVLYGGLFEKARDASDATKAAQVREAIMLAKADIISEYYTNNHEIDITESKIKSMIESYLDGVSITVKKIEGKNKYQIKAQGIELDNEDGILDLSSISSDLEDDTQEEDIDLSNLRTSAEDQAISIFNISFSVYEGEQKGSSVKMLLTAIEASNESNSDHQIDVDKTIDEIETSKKYEVSFEKDSEGYINRANIEEK